jgi:predicted GTPase
VSARGDGAADLKRERVVIMGAGGRDFHNFNMVYRDDARYEVIAFTAAQIPFIERRRYPSDLAGNLYPDGIMILPESSLRNLIAEHKADRVVFAYSDVSHEQVMHTASLCLSVGADFILHGPEKTMLQSRIPVISVCAVRTGCGKSIVTRKLARLFMQQGVKASVIRHPMAYCDFAPVVKLASMHDIDRRSCTIEEREEFEPLVEKGVTVFAGVDYRKVLDEAERASQVIIWDGGNNDFPFVLPDLEIVLLDSLRPGHETLFYPGEVNLRRGNALIITKVNEAREGDVAKMKESVRRVNADAAVFETSSIFALSDPEMIKGKQALVIEDGPTMTHGGLPSGAGVSASKGSVSGFVDPKPYAVGSLNEIYDKFPHIGTVLPAMGYSDVQIRELEETIAKVPADVVIAATPVDLRRIMKINKLVVRVFYDFDIDLRGIVESFVDEYVH